MAYSQSMRLPDGQELLLYNDGNTKKGSVRMDGTSLLIGADGDIHIASTTNLLLKGTTATIGGVSGINSTLSLGTSGDKINLNVSGVTYNVGTLTGSPTITGSATINGALTVKGNAAVTGILSPGSMSGTVDATDMILSYARDGDYAKIHFVDYGVNQDWLTLEFGDDLGQDRVRFRTTTGVNVLDVISNAVDSSVTVKAPTFTEGGKELSDKYLAIGAKAVDADKLDGLQATKFMRKDTSNTVVGAQTFYGTNTVGGYSSAPIELREVGAVASAQVSNNYAPALTYHWSGRNQGQLAMEADGTFVLRDGTTHDVTRTLNAGNLKVKGESVWHAGNFTPNSKFDVTGGIITGASEIKTSAATPLNLVRTTSTENVGIYFANAASSIYAGAVLSTTSKEFSIGTDAALNGSKFRVNAVTGEIAVNGNKVWHAGNDGSGSGLDADTVDGLNSVAFMRSDGNTSTTGNLSVGGTIGIGGNTLTTNGSYFRLTSPHGNLDMGMQNTAWAHFTTTATSGFYFYKNISINGSSVVTEARTIASGDGITGGGTLADNRTLAIDTTWLNKHGDARWVNKSGDTMSGSLSFSAQGTAGTERVYMNLQGTSANDAANENGGAFIQFSTSTSSGYGGMIGAVRKVGGASELVFKNGAQNPPETMRINTGGDVGIGISSPTQKLHVNGNIRASQIHIGTKRKDDEWDEAYAHKSSTGADHTYINQDVKTTASPTFNELSLSNNHFTNKFIGNVASTEIDALILLCRADLSGAGNHVAGKLYGRRVSGNTHTAILDVLVNSTSSSGSIQVAGFINSMSVQQVDAYSLVTATYGGVAYAAVRIEQGINLEFSGGVWFSGQCASTGPEHLKIIATSLATNVTLVSSHTIPYQKFGAPMHWPGGNSARANESYAHLSDKANPHGVTTSQIGAVPTGRTISTATGSGLTGGGSLASNRTLAFDTTWGDGRYSLATHNHKDAYLDMEYASGVVVDVNNTTPGTKLFLGSSGSWTNRGPSGNNATALLSLNTHTGSYYSQLWFDTQGENFYYRSISNGSIRPWNKVWTDGNFTPSDYSLATHNHDSVYLKKAGDKMTSDLEVVGHVTISGSNLYMDAPSTTGGWARGMNFRNSSSALYAAIGMLGSGTSSTMMYLSYESYDSGKGLYIHNGGNISVGTTANNGSRFHVSNDGKTGDAFYVNTGLTPGTSTLFEHKLNSVATPYRIQKSSYAGAVSTAGILNLHMNSSAVGVGSNLYFTANSSTGVERQYAGLGATVVKNTNGAEDGSLDFYTMKAGASLKGMTLSKDGNLGIGTTPHATYTLSVGGDILNTGWIRTTGTSGLFFESHGGGWQMTDSTWIRAYNSKALLADRMRTALLEVGSGTTAAAATDLTVTGASLNYRNTLYADATNVGVNTVAPKHPLHVYTSLTHQGIALQTSSNSYTNGIAFMTSGGNYNWHIARDGVGGDNPDMVFYGGPYQTTLQGLKENVRLKNGGGMDISDGDLSISSKNAWVTVKSSTSGLDGTDQAAGISIGESGYKGGAALHITYTGNGYGHIGMGSVSTTTSIPEYSVMKMHYQSRDVEFLGSVTVKGNVSADNILVTSGNGDGVRYWGSSAYSTYMSTSTDAAHGGTLPWVTGDDYNMYFKMSTNNRGFAFTNPNQGGVNAMIEGNGRVNSNVGFRTKKFEMAYNEAEDSLDFIYHG